MRNFKKFLALVLAMLMVSACAVSVSAAYTDQAAVDASGYAEAIEMLSKLGVVQGDENKNYNPNNTLRRDEAAVIIAKLVAGVTPVEWTAETTKFDDVDAKWSFAYINYVADRKIMIGTDKGFEPTRELQIDEALALALKATSPSKLREVEIETAQFPTNYWADYYISAADELGLTDKLGIIYDYEAACSRAMFAQIAVNMLNYSYTEGTGNNAVVVTPIGDGFGYASELALVANVDATNGNVTLTSLVEGRTIPTIKLDAFNAALKDAGYEKTAADLVNYKVSMQWSTKTYAIYDVEVLTKIDTYTYATEAIKYVPTAADPNAVEAGKLEINGKVYDINSVDQAAGSITQIGGSASADTNNIRVYNNPIGKATLNEITTVVKGETIPAYYAVDCYDDNGDGDYERAYVTEYKLVTFTKSETKVNHDGNTDTDDVNATVVNEFAADGSAADKFIKNDRYLTVAGAGYTAWGETPVLANILVVDGANISAKILETAVKVTGTVSGIKADTYITIDGKNINFAAGYADPASWILGQKVSVYTIGGKYVSVASADTGVESGMVEKNVRVDNVVVENGNAIITGFVGNTFEAITLKVVGVAEGEGAAAKLLAKTSYEIENKVKVGADGKLNDAGTEKVFPGQVAIIKTTDDAGAVTETYVAFEDGKNYVFCVTSAGAYYKAEADEFDFDAAATTLAPAAGSDKNAVEFKNGYIYVDGTAQYKLASSFIVVTPDPASDTEHGFYDDTVKIEADKNIVAVNEAKLALLEAAIAPVSAGTVDKTVAVVYVKSITNPTSTDVVVDKLAEGQTIVQIASKESESLTYNTYNAIDLFTGEKVTVTGTATEKKFYVVKDGAIVEEAKWVKTQTVTSETVLDMQTIKAYNTKLVNGNLTADGDIAVFGIDAIKVWKTENGIIKEAGARADAIADKLNGTVEVLAYIDNGQMIIIK